MAVPSEIRVSIDWTCSPRQLQLGTWYDFGEADTILSELKCFQLLEPKAGDYTAKDKRIQIVRCWDFEVCLMQHLKNVYAIS